MANFQTNNIQISPRPLTVADAAGLEASVVPQLWSPTQILETDVNDPIAISVLALDGDVWRVNIIPPSALPGLVFYPIGFRWCLFNTDNDVGFNDLFEQRAIVSLQSVFDDGADRPHNYYSFTSEAPHVGFDATGVWKIQSFEPPFEGFPPKLPVADADAPTEDALGSFIIQVKTFEAVAAGNTSLHVDARYLAFPRSVLKSAGFYLPRVWFKPA